MATTTIDEKVLIRFEADLKTLKNSMNDAEKQTKNTTSNMIKQFNLVSVSLGAVAGGMTKMVKDGMAYNNAMEQNVNGLASLAAATSSNVDSMGNLLTAQQKFTMAQQESVLVMKELEKINTTTPHTLDQTNKIYKSMYVSMKNVGASTNDMVQITKQLSIAAGAAGIEFNSLLAGVDGLATGTVLVNSDLGRFLGSIGLTNEELKNTTDIVALLNDKLGEFQTSDTMAVAVSNLTNAWDKFAGSITSDLFSNTKDVLNEMADVLNLFNRQSETARILDGDIYELEGLKELDQRWLAVKIRIEETEEEIANFSGIQKTFRSGMIEDTKVRLSGLQAEYEALTSLMEIELAKGKLVNKNNAAVKEGQDQILKALEDKVRMEEEDNQALEDKAFFALQAANAAEQQAAADAWYTDVAKEEAAAVREVTAAIIDKTAATTSDAAATQAALGMKDEGYTYTVAVSNINNGLQYFAEVINNTSNSFNDFSTTINTFNTELMSQITALQSISNSLGITYSDRAQSTLFGAGDAGSLSFDMAKANAEAAWEVFQGDTTNKDLLDAYNEKMGLMIGTLQEFNDTAKFTTKFDQDFAKAVAYREVKQFDEAQLEQKEEIDRQVEVLEAIDKNTNYITSGNTVDLDNTKISHTYFQSGTTNDNVYWERMDYNYYKNGGYTGDMNVNAEAGIVHGQEYVVNAATTKDLGLNGQGGTFDDMRNLLYQIAKDTKKSVKIERNTNQLIAESA